VADQILQQLLQSIDAGQSVALVTVVEATGNYVDALGNRILLWLDKPPMGDVSLGEMNSKIVDDARHCLSTRRPKMLKYSLADGNIGVFVEVQRRPPVLIIAGAGHVALPLAQLGKLIDFEVVVLDDRPRFANKQRFPMADKVLAQPFRETLREWPIDNDTFIVLVTRGHSHDVECLLEVLDSPARYIGMIGSKRRVKMVFDLLEQEQGINPTSLNKVYAPIGLDVGAEAPGEIAVAIIGEIINVYRGGRAISLSDALGEDRRLPLHPGRSK